jgi:RNA polymerase sigma-70 factor (ECF subfamily)
MNPKDDFEGFIRRYQDMVYTTAVRLLASPAEAEDVAQEAFLKAYERRDELDPVTVGGWLKTVATNLALNHLARHRARHVELDESAPFRAQEPKGDTGLEAALDVLPEAQRVPLVLFHFHEMSYEDIAAQLSVSVSKIKTDIFRGRQALKKVLEAEHG